MALLAYEIFGVRLIGVSKDQMSRYIIDALDREKIGIASGTYAIVEVPPIRVVQTPALPQDAR